MSNVRSYIVQPGDTPGTLAGRHGFDLEDLFRANPTLPVVTDKFGERNIYRGYFKQGQRINLPVTTTGVLGQASAGNVGCGCGGGVGAQCGCGGIAAPQLRRVQSAFTAYPTGPQVSSSVTLWYSTPSNRCYAYVKPLGTASGPNMGIVYTAKTIPAASLITMFSKALSDIYSGLGQTPPQWKTDEAQVKARILSLFPTPYDLVSRTGWNVQPNDSPTTYAFRLGHLDTCLKMMKLLGT